jgi:predicted enzyme related to lactoylglutathione lyase
MSKAKKAVSRIIWFEVPADDTERAKAFYKKLFGWKINPMPHMEEYFHMDTGGPDAAPDGAIMKRMHANQTITSYVSVPSVAKFIGKIEKLGGNICKPKTAVPGMGYFAVCNDTENNTFAIWEMNAKAK